MYIKIVFNHKELKGINNQQFLVSDSLPTKYKDIIRFENGRFVLLQSFANFSEYREESDFSVIVTIKVSASVSSIIILHYYKIDIYSHGVVDFSLHLCCLQVYFCINCVDKMLFQATGSNGQTSKKLSFTIYVMVAPISSSQQTSLSQTDEIMILSQSTKNIIIIVLGGVVVLLSVALVYAIYRIRRQKKKAKDGETTCSYEEVKRNTVTNENVYATIQNQLNNL